MDKEIKRKISRNWFKVLQEMICNEIETLEGKSDKFISKNWTRNPHKDEGGGEYRILKNGKLFDKVGVNFSEVYGKFPKGFNKNIDHTIFCIFYKNFYYACCKFFGVRYETIFSRYHLLYLASYQFLHRTIQKWYKYTSY